MLHRLFPHQIAIVAMASKASNAVDFVRMSSQTPLHCVTPLVRSQHLSASLGRDIYFKLDCLQPPGSFKIRGMGRVVQSARDAGACGVVSSSGGNAGLATAYAAQRLGLDCTVVLPTSTPKGVLRSLETLYGARVIVSGSVWDEANVEAERLARETRCPLIHPFNDPVAWEGHASVVEEVVTQLREANVGPPDCFVTSVGGGGLLMGIIRGVERYSRDTRRIVAVETLGADSFDRSFRAGKALTLPNGITSIAKSLGATTPSGTIVANALASGIVVTKTVSDADAVAACISFAKECRHVVEPACGASLATVYNPGHAADIFDDDVRSVVIQVCGGAVVDIAALVTWAAELGVDMQHPQ